MTRLLKDRKGSVTLLYFGLCFLLLSMTFLIIEMGATMENYSYAEMVLQRACNSAVEANIDDAYRADRILIMDPAGAEADFLAFAAADLPDSYRLTVTGIYPNVSPPSMTVTGTLTFRTLLNQYGFRELTHSFRVVSTNYDLT